MDSTKQKTIAYVLAAVLLAVAVVCYAAFPTAPPAEPVRILLTSTAGNVLFDHQEHASEDGYYLDCDACHHEYLGGDEPPESCGLCHDPEGEYGLKRSEAFHTQCIGCHEADGIAPTACGSCHAF